MKDVYLVNSGIRSYNQSNALTTRLPCRPVHELEVFKNVPQIETMSPLMVNNTSYAYIYWFIFIFIFFRQGPSGIMRQRNSSAPSGIFLK